MSSEGKVRHAIPAAQWGMIVVAALAAVFSLFHTPYPDLAPLQNLPTLVILVGLIWILRRWPMTTPVFACIVAFLLLHTLGGRYIYSYVPYDAWAKVIGLPAPSEVFGFQRNMYDRLVHFSFGLLMVPPIAQALWRYGGVRQGLAIYVAVEFVFAGSALYEIFEWLLTIIMAGSADDYNGQQGDMWDSQKDMACAASGAVIAAMGVGLKRLFKSSPSLSRGGGPLA